jgi:hypothetical protein
VETLVALDVCPVFLTKFHFSTPNHIFSCRQTNYRLKMDNDTEPLEGSQSSTSGYGSRDDVGRIPPAQRYLRRDSLTEISNRPRTQGSLNVLDVFSLIVNKMVGTGIFTAPASVFLMTGNRITTLCLFFAGFLYTIVR